jgi:hypothetical protein
VEFTGMVTRDGRIQLPPDVASSVPPGENLHIVVNWDAQEADLAWRMAGLKRFEAAYSPEDAIYEKLIDDPAIR